MKKLIFVMLMGAVVIAIGCNKKSGGDSSTTATTPTTPNPCVTAGTCADPNWANYPGFAPYGRTNGLFWGASANYTNGFCGCDSGFMPASNGSSLSCVNTTYIPTTPLYYNWSATAFVFTYGYGSVGGVAFYQSGYGQVAGGGPSNWSMHATRNNAYARAEQYGTLGGGSCYNQLAIPCNYAAYGTVDPICTNAGGRCYAISGGSYGICGR